MTLLSSSINIETTYNFTFNFHHIHDSFQITDIKNNLFYYIYKKLTRNAVCYINALSINDPTDVKTKLSRSTWFLEMKKKIRENWNLLFEKLFSYINIDQNLQITHFNLFIFFLNFKKPLDMIIVIFGVWWGINLQWICVIN